MTWDEGKVSRILARNTFKSALCVLPNCTWTGDEIDLLVVPPCLRIVDVEIKVTKMDLKADRRKDRWWRRPSWHSWYVGPAPPAEELKWPRMVWKHYYAMPVDLWHVDLMDIVWPTSGILLVDDRGGGHGMHGYAAGTVECVQRAAPNPDAKPLSPGVIHGLARLASLRMWDAYRDAERQRVDHAKRIAMYEFKP